MAGSGFRNLEWYIPYLYSQPGTLIDYLPAEGAWLIVEDVAELLASLADLEGQAEQLAPRPDARRAISPRCWPHRISRAEAMRERLAARPAVCLGQAALSGVQSGGNGWDAADTNSSATRPPGGWPTTSPPGRASAARCARS